MFLLPLILIFVNEQIDYAHLKLGIASSINNIFIALFIDWSVTNFAKNFVGKILNSPPFVFLGMMSYSIYLWQQPFLNPAPPSRIFEFPFSIAGVLAFTCISYFAVEKYSLDFRHKFERRLFG
jgi:peptidoglycan/LPS O-acetylase OafA/YrhL